MSNFSKIFLIIFMIITILVLAYFMISARTNTYWGRWFAWKASDIDDYQRFPFHPVDNAPPVFFFDKNLRPDFFYLNIAYEYKGKPQTSNLDELLQQSGTTAFIVIKDDAILYENYFNGYSRDSINTSFSIAKSVTSLLVGIAIDQGHIENIHDPITTYIPELLDVNERYDLVTIEHLLSMKSGIEFVDHDLPWGDKPKAYYHPRLREIVLKLEIEEEPGNTFAYNTYNPILLGIALEWASGKTVSQLFEENLWKKLGMEFDASWSIDSEEDNMVKMESGINARAIDFAKIGRLVLNNGLWGDEQIVSSVWLDRSLQIDSSNNVAKFGDSIFYQTGWWVYAPAGSDQFTIFGWGHLGQYLFIFPEEDMIVLRFGKKIGRVDSWRQIAQEVVELAGASK
jgi:CubicO group peptidase (beta-lactamase class C family)